MFSYEVRCSWILCIIKMICEQPASCRRNFADVQCLRLETHFLTLAFSKGVPAHEVLSQNCYGETSCTKPCRAIAPSARGLNPYMG